MFKPGESGNVTGRPLGAKGRKSVVAFENLLEIFSDNMPRLREEIGKLQGEAFVREMRGFAEFILPKQSRVISMNLSAEAEGETIREIFRIGEREFEL